MIHRLRRRFIAIAMTSVTLVMCLMALSINVFNFLSTDGALSDTLRVIYENQGSIPPPPEGGPDGPPGGRFTQETPYSTRYFILAYRGDGTLELADMRHIAAVTEEDADTYLSIALAHGEGMGYTEEYKYCVIHTGKDRYAAIFLDCQQELYSVRTFAWISLLGSGGMCDPGLYPDLAVLQEGDRANGEERGEAETVHHGCQPRIEDAADSHHHQPEGVGDGDRGAEVDRQGPGPGGKDGRYQCRDQDRTVSGFEKDDSERACPKGEHHIIDAEPSGAESCKSVAANIARYRRCTGYAPLLLL